MSICQLSYLGKVVNPYRAFAKRSDVRKRKRNGREKQRGEIESFPLFLRYSILPGTGDERVISLSVHSNTVASVLCGSFELLKFIQYLTSSLRGIK